MTAEPSPVLCKCDWRDEPHEPTDLCPKWAGDAIREPFSIWPATARKEEA